MKSTAWAMTAVIALLIAGVFFAGCSDNSTTSDSGTQAAVAQTTPGALYSPGDIVKNPKSTMNSALLIIAYDPATDMYERALIYPNNDGSWGYRTDSKTEKVSRLTLEKTYTSKVGTVEVSSVKIGAPTTATTVATTATTQATTAVTATETTESTTAPKIQDIDPFIGTAGTTVSITDLKGLNFVSGATVSLTKSGETSIAATGVSVSSPTKITCTFVIPLSASAGSWNVVVTNPDKQSYTSASLFEVYKNTSVSSSVSTTGTTAAVTVTIYSLNPSAQSFGGQAYSNYVFDIIGSNLGSGAKVTFTQGSTTFTSTEYSTISSSDARAKIDIPAGAPIGMYTVSILDSSGTTISTLANGFEIK